MKISLVTPSKAFCTSPAPEGPSWVSSFASTTGGAAEAAVPFDSAGVEAAAAAAAGGASLTSFVVPVSSGGGAVAASSTTAFPPSDWPALGSVLAAGTGGPALSRGPTLTDANASQSLFDDSRPRASRGSFQSAEDQSRSATAHTTAQECHSRRTGAATSKAAIVPPLTRRRTLSGSRTTFLVTSGASYMPTPLRPQGDL
mmetsp:Transcript_28681/g.69903  ORF Transcript_28681/g.69903 Transcript_28681/m.69903 type:complete len:200 (+) Transcript_28681:432-1031(+)